MSDEIEKNGKRQKIKESSIRLLVQQNQEMFELLQSWPEREIMMDFEKDWNEKRLRFLQKNPGIPEGLEELGQ